MLPPYVAVLLPALAGAIGLPGPQPLVAVARRDGNDTVSSTVPVVVPSDTTTTIPLIPTDTTTTAPISTTDTGISTDTSISSDTGISITGISTTEISTDTGVSTAEVSTDTISTTGISTTGISTTDASTTGISTDTGIPSTTTAPPSTTTALAVITPDPATVSADTTESVEGVTGNTLQTSTNDDGSTTVLPILFGVPCLIFCEHIGPGGGPGAIVLHGIGPGDGEYILPPIAGVVPPPSAVIIQNGVPTPVESGTDPDDPEDPDETNTDEDQSTATETQASTTEASTTEATSTTESGTAAASYGVTTIVIDFEPSDVSSATSETVTSETVTSGTAAASYGVTTIVVDFEPSDVTSATSETVTSETVTSDTTTSGTAAASYGVTTVVVDYDPTTTSGAVTSETTTGEDISTTVTSDSVTSTITSDLVTSTVTSDSATSTVSSDPSTTLSSTTLITSTTGVSTTATETGPPLCLPYQDPHEGLSYCQCSSGDIVATMPIFTTDPPCPWTTFTLPPTTTAPPATSPVYTFTDPSGAVIACPTYSTWGIGGSITATSCLEPSTTISEAPGPTGDPQNCIFQGDHFSDADCFLGICGSTRHQHGSSLYIPGDDEPNVLWSDEDTDPTENQPWNFDEDSIGIQEAMSFSWDGDKACGCTVDGNDVEGEMTIYEDGDDGFTYWSEDWVCACQFECHPTG